MADRRLALLTPSDKERLELKALEVRRKTWQALAVRARTVLAYAEGHQNEAASASGRMRRRLASSGGVLLGAGWRAYSLSRVPAHLARLTMTALRPSS